MNKIEISDHFFADLDLRHSLFEFFFENSKNSGYGPELKFSGLKSKTLSRVYPDANITFFPVLKSGAYYIFCSQLYPSSEIPENNKWKPSPDVNAYVEWPVSFGPITKSIITSYPSPALIVELVNGEENVQHFIEPLDPIRLILQSFIKSGHLKVDNITSMSPYGSRSINDIINEIQPVDIWQDSLQTNSLLPTLSYAFMLTKDSIRKPVSSLSLLTLLSNKPLSNVLVLGSPEFLTSFIEDCEQRLAKHETLETHDFRNTVTLKTKNFPVMELRTVSPKTSAELSTLPSFISKDALLLANYDSLSVWTGLVAKSTVKAIEQAEKRYSEWTKMSISHSQKENYFRFSNRLARNSGRLIPRTFDILLAAQSCIDSNFAFELLKECYDSPRNDLFESQFPCKELDFNALGLRTESFSISRFSTIQSQKILRPKLKTVHNKRLECLQTPDIDESKYSDPSWATENLPYTCSFPEEDIFMEDYALHCREQFSEAIRVKETSTREMQATLGDGLDIRETARNIHLDKIFVKEELHQGLADVGAVIFQFVQQEHETEYSWVSYWLAEKHDRSDLMFYATPYANEIIGPGIARSEFGGFAAIPLPNYLENPWSHPFVRHFSKSMADALLIASAMATEHKTILHIGICPPSAEASSLLKRSGKSVIHVSLDAIPSEKLLIIRTFHILAEAGVRKWAQKYIRKDL